MSEDIFYQNSYRILGLLSLERGRVITRRGKEIIKLMRIGEMPTYPNDLFYPAQRRTIESVRQAMEKLGYEEGYVKDSFWWFQSQSEHDEKALILMQTFHIDEAFAIWNNACAQNPNDYVALKNIAIICTMLCYGSRLNHDYLETSVRIWGSLLHDEAFWSWFSGLCYHHDTLIITPKVIDSFRSKIAAILFEYYEHTAMRTDDPRVFNLFWKYFGTNDENVRSFAIDPVFTSIREKLLLAKNFELIWSLSDNQIILSNESTSAIRSLLDQVVIETTRIRRMALWDISEMMLLRNTIADVLRNFHFVLRDEAYKKCKGRAIGTVLELAGLVLLSAKIHADSMDLISAIEKDIADLDRRKAENAEFSWF